MKKCLAVFDGFNMSKSTLNYSTKMLSYLFGNFTNVPVEVFTVKEHYMAKLRVPENKLMSEFVKRRFPSATYTVVKGAGEEQMVARLRNHKENDLVPEAYWRSQLSRWFKICLADVLMKELDTPLFIAHNK